MPQTVQVLRTITNNAPPALLPGAMSVETSGYTKLWLGSHTGNRLLISDNPAELPIAGNNYLPLAGGQLQGALTLASDPLQPLQASTRQYVDARAWQANPNNVFTYGRRGTGWIGIPSFDRIGASSGWDPGSIDPTNSGLIGIWSVVNQGGAGTGWPADNVDQTAMILHGYNSNGGWQNQLMMGGRERGGGAAIWYRSTGDGGWQPWRRLIGDSGGAFTGGINFGSAVAAGPADLSRHIALWGTTFGFSVTSARLNHNASPNHVFLSNGVDIVTINATGLQMSPTRMLTLAGAPTLDLHAASKRYVDDLVGTVESVTTLAGAYDVANDMVRPVEGVSVAGPLPAPAAANKGWYLIIEEGGFGIGNAPPQEMYVGDWMISTGTAWAHLNLNLETVEAHNVAIAPIQDLVAMNVQDALAELPTKAYVDAHDPAIGNYLPLTGGDLSGDLSVHATVYASGGVWFSVENDFGCYIDRPSGNRVMQYNAEWYDGWIASNGARVWSYSGYNLMTLDSVGILTVTGSLVATINVEGERLYAINGLYPSIYNGWEWQFATDDGTGDKYQTYRAGGWLDVWRSVNGQREWWSNNQAGMILLPWGDLSILGANATKAAAGPWDGPSDVRVKVVVGDYTAGLAEVVQLQPRRYRFKTDFTAQAVSRYADATAPELIGLIAQECEEVMPEMVMIGPGEIAGQPVDDFRSMDIGPLTFALLNAVKEIDARLRAGGL